VTRKPEKLVCICVLVTLLLISACGEYQSQYTENAMVQKSAPAEASRQVDAVHVAAEGLDDAYDMPEGSIGVSQPDVPQLQQMEIDPFGLPVSYHDYYAALCNYPQCPGWVEEYIVETDIEACNPYGVWRYTYNYTQIQDFMGFKTTSVCYFQLPRDENGKIISGTIECHGISTTLFSGDSGDYSTTIVFKRRPLSFNGNPVHINGDLACEWGTAGSDIPYPAECLQDADCGENRICDMGSFTCHDSCVITPCPENSACYTHTGRCMECPTACPQDFVCAINYYHVGGIEADCLNNCNSESCQPGLECLYNFEFESCEVQLEEMQPAEGCDPVCPEGFECMVYPGNEDNLICVNYCDTPDCPQEGYLCALYENGCVDLVTDHSEDGEPKQ